MVEQRARGFMLENSDHAFDRGHISSRTVLSGLLKSSGSTAQAAGLQALLNPSCSPEP